ncbi:MAG: phosphate acyltransferase PlsX [Candidatus Eisenbacteria bacterium]|nr:phosphate acyltransferase PlsX [Candidatus Eisenbacteria bacterium]
MDPDQSEISIPRIGVDAMGGDSGPRVVVQGVIQALAQGNGRFESVLLGDKNLIEKEIASFGEKPNRFRIIHAPEQIEMGESAIAAFKTKKASSIVVGANMQKEGELDALVSAGNTGAVVATTLLCLGRLENALRPAIAAFFPNKMGGCIVLDVGANSDCKPAHLLQFAVMGRTYAKFILDRPEPRIGLLNIGEESSKGNELAQNTHKLLAHSGLNFVGNIEGTDIFGGGADVVVCDGFTGNVVLKVAESVEGLLSSAISEQVAKSVIARLGSALLKPAFRRFRQQLDYAEYGGAPLLGVNGVCIIGHGRSSAKAIMNAIKVAARVVENRVNDHIRKELKVFGGTGEGF